MRLHKHGPLTRADWVLGHILTIACTPGSISKALRRGLNDSDPRAQVRLVRIDCPYKAGAPWLLARVDLVIGAARVVNAVTGERFDSNVAELAEAATRGMDTPACQRWQVRHALRLRATCKRLGVRLVAAKRGANPLAGSGALLNSRLHPSLGRIERVA